MFSSMLICSFTAASEVVWKCILQIQCSSGHMAAISACGLLPASCKGVVKPTDVLNYTRQGHASPVMGHACCLAALDSSHLTKECSGSGAFSSPWVVVDRSTGATCTDKTLVHLPP